MGFFFKYVGGGELEPVIFVFLAISALLYPYSKFVYDSIMNFLLGGRAWAMPTIIYLPWAFFTRYFLWAGAFIVAPIGILFLYIYHTKNHTFDEIEE